MMINNNCKEKFTKEYPKVKKNISRFLRLINKKNKNKDILSF